ncbi:MAG: HD domain-containing protein [Clostridia bacterium]
MQSQPQPPLSGIIKGQVFEGFLLVKAAEQRTSSNGSKYLDMTLCDRTGDINAKMWDGVTPAPAACDVVKVRGMVQEYNGRAQLRVDRLREPEARDQVDMAQLVPCAPLPAEEMKQALFERAERMADPQLRELVLERLREAGERLDYYPAAVKLHHAERSGLLHHTSTMLRAAEAVCQVYATLDGDLLAAGVILHDLCKLSEMNADKIGLAGEYSTEGELLGHLVEGVAELARAGEKMGTRRELLLMLEHMILSHHDMPEYGSPKRPMFPEAEVLHTLDLMDARMFEMNQALSQVQPGTFTERIWSLERKLYRRK